MRINELVRKSIGFLGVLDPSGAFVPYGTGFVTLWAESGLIFSYLVTAKHVIDNMRATTRPMIGRLNDKHGNAQLGLIESDHWVTHQTIQNCDIAVAPIFASWDTFDMRGIDLINDCLTDDYIEKNDVGVGDAVYMVGLLTAHFDVTRNVSIVRVGNIASMPDEPINLDKLGYQEVYLIENRSLGGLSGSPVFLQTPPFRLINGSVTVMDGHKREYILGINIGLFEVNAHRDKAPSEAAVVREHFLEDMSAGISIVVPIQQAIEIIRDSKLFQEGRQKTINRTSRQSGFVQTTGEPSPVPPGPETE